MENHNFDIMVSTSNPWQCAVNSSEALMTVNLAQPNTLLLTQGYSDPRFIPSGTIASIAYKTMVEPPPKIPQPIPLIMLIKA